MLPWVSGEFVNLQASGFSKAIRKINFLFIGVGLSYTACVWLFARWLIALLYGGKYVEYTSLVPVFALAIVLNAASQASAIALRAMKRPSEVFWAYTASAVLTITLVPFLCRQLGLLGVALGFLGSSLVFFVAISWRYRTQLRLLDN